MSIFFRLPFPRQQLIDILARHGYDLISDIGSGAQGCVYLTLSHRDHEEYAIKVGEDKTTVQELQVLQTIWHPNIIYIYETFLEFGLTFIVLEYCPGGTIADNLTKGPLPTDQLFSISEQLINALRACHAAKIAHGDIKPHNIFLNKRGRAKLADFGLAKIHETEYSFQFKGSIGYLAPEVLHHDAFDPFKADVWSLGITLYAMAAGKLPWPPEIRQNEFYEYINGGLREVDPIVPEQLVALIQSMVVPDPAKRVSLDQINSLPISAAIGLSGGIPTARTLKRGRGQASGRVTKSGSSLTYASLWSPIGSDQELEALLEELRTQEPEVPPKITRMLSRGAQPTI